MSGSFTDTGCKVQQGKFYYFHPNGNLKSAGEYIKGKKQGVWYSFYSDEKLQDLAMYENGNRIGTSLSWHRNGFIADSSVYNADGSGIHFSWFDNGVPGSAVFFSAGYKKNGKWQFFHKNGKLSSIEIYENDQLVNKEYFNEEGNPMDTANTDREASFKGGKEGWRNYLLEQLYFPLEYKIENADRAIVGVQGVVDEDGKVTNVEVMSPFFPVMDRIAVKAVENSPKWIPAMQHNRRVKYQFYQFVTFRQK